MWISGLQRQEDESCQQLVRLEEDPAAQVSTTVLADTDFNPLKP